MKIVGLLPKERSRDSIVGIVTTPQARQPRVRNPTREDVPLILNVQTCSEAHRAWHMSVGVASVG